MKLLVFYYNSALCPHFFFNSNVYFSQPILLSYKLQKWYINFKVQLQATEMMSHDTSSHSFCNLDSNFAYFYFMHASSMIVLLLPLTKFCWYLSRLIDALKESIAPFFSPLDSKNLNPIIIHPSYNPTFSFFLRNYDSSYKYSICSSLRF